MKGLTNAFHNTPPNLCIDLTGIRHGQASGLSNVQGHLIDQEGCIILCPDCDSPLLIRRDTHFECTSCAYSWKPVEEEELYEKGNK